MRKQVISLLVVLLIVVVAVLSFILYNELPLLTGKKIILATRPVDPFDPFIGQYIRINYEISMLNADGFNPGDNIYVLLEQDPQGIWRFKGASKYKPSGKDFIKGRVVRVNGKSVSVEYGIEQFFFERHAKLPTGNITTEVKVGSSGRAKLVQLLSNGQPIEIEYENISIRS